MEEAFDLHAAEPLAPQAADLPFRQHPAPLAALERIDAELKMDAALRLGRAALGMERFLSREESLRLGADDPTRVLGKTLLLEARRLLRGALAEAPGPAPSLAAPVAESTLRSAYRLISALGTLAAWSAPASQESSALNSFPVAAARDVVAYSRYGCPDTAVQEHAYTSMLGFDALQARLLLTSSGMAAYALIENFLLRDVLEPGDGVVMHPGVYFETQHQLRSLEFLTVTEAGAGFADMRAAIEHRQPRVVFVDPLTNSAELRVLDIERLLDEAERVCRHETWFVIDGTLLSGGFDAFARVRRHVRVLYYESGCKYLQFGMDLGPAGIVVVDSRLAERFERLRRGSGAIAPESLVLPRASRQSYLDYLQLQTASAGALERAVTGYSGPRGAVFSAVFPSQPNHTDHLAAMQYAHLGGVVTFRFADPRLNRRAPLEAYIDTLMIQARSRKLPLTAGVSFGFRVPRIGAAWSSYDADGAFLRVSAGVSPEIAARLGVLIAECAHEFAHEFA
jgi:cystathionine gamma-synthase